MIITDGMTHNDGMEYRDFVNTNAVAVDSDPERSFDLWIAAILSPIPDAQ
jgi:hypothetical protein